MTPHLQTRRVTLHHGDCREVLAQLADASVDAVVTDPPYELGFMGKAWDASGVAYDAALWAEVLRVLKPGGHLLAFGGTRTYHRLACAVEDAGFEIRDSIHWLYGSGFPKSLDVSKAIDKQRYDRAEVYEVTAWVRQARDAAGITNRDIDAAFGFSGMAGHWTSAASQPSVPTLEQVPTLLDVLGVAADDVPDDVRRLLWDLNGRKGQPGENWARREVVGEKVSGIANRDEAPRHTIGAGSSVVVPITAPATPEAEQWQGWGTALKPAHEPVVVARKPLEGTVAANVLAHGTGALNVDGCRVGTTVETWPSSRARPKDASDPYFDHAGSASQTVATGDVPPGRWPANVVLDGEAAAELDRQSGESATHRIESSCQFEEGKGWSRTLENRGPRGFSDSGGASRFFFRADLTDDDLTSFRYVAKPDRAERDAGLGDLAKNRKPMLVSSKADPEKLDEVSARFLSAPIANVHPTVKPLDLMRWLVRLVTPPGGVVLDPFTGSGTTLAAAVLEDRRAVGIELTEDYLPIVAGRVAWAEREARFGAVQGPTKVRKETPGAVSLFDEVEQ